MKEYDIDYDSFIGGWYMPEEVCDSVVDVLNSEQEKMVDGKIFLFNEGNDQGDGPRPDWKKCKELFIQSNEFGKIQKYIENLSVCLELYKERYSHCDDVAFYGLNNTDIKIQHYMPGDGFYKWHCENAGYGVNLYRHLVFMTYLNTLDNAVTDFYYQKTTTPCEKGLTLIWPAAWTHTHRGVTNYKGEKTIITGWFSFDADQ